MSDRIIYGDVLSYDIHNCDVASDIVKTQ